MIKAESKAYFRSLGAHIAQLRKARGITQSELSRAIGVSPQAVFAYELGARRTSVLVLVRVAKALRISVETLIGMAQPDQPRKGRVSPRAIRNAERLQGLSKTDQRFVVKIIDTLEDRAGGGRRGAP